MHRRPAAIDRTTVPMHVLKTFGDSLKNLRIVSVSHLRSHKEHARTRQSTKACCCLPEPVRLRASHSDACTVNSISQILLRDFALPPIFLFCAFSSPSVDLKSNSTFGIDGQPSQKRGLSVVSRLFFSPALQPMSDNSRGNVRLASGIDPLCIPSPVSLVATHRPYHSSLRTSSLFNGDSITLMFSRWK
jgi:hypothetical protein